MTIRELIDELRAASEVVGPDAPVAGVVIPRSGPNEEVKISEIVANRQRAIVRLAPMTADESATFFGVGSNGH